MDGNSVEIGKYFTVFHSALPALTAQIQIGAILVRCNVYPTQTPIDATSCLVKVRNVQAFDMTTDSIHCVGEFFCALMDHVVDGTSGQRNPENIAKQVVNPADADRTDRIECHDKRLQGLAILDGCFYFLWKRAPQFFAAKRATYFHRFMCCNADLYRSIRHTACLNRTSRFVALLIPGAS